MTLKRLALTLSLALGVGGFGLLNPPPAQADDTEIYFSGATRTTDMPLVMFSLDYRSNLGSSVADQNAYFTAQLGNDPDIPAAGSWTFFDLLRLSLKVVMKDLEGVKVGLMLNHDNSNNCVGLDASRCSNGGYIAMGFDEFQANDGNGAKARFHTILHSMPMPSGNQAHSYQGKELFFEFFRYLTGQGILNGHNGYTDYATNNTYNLNADYPAIDWDSAIENVNNTRYISPLVAGMECAKIYTVNFMFQVSNQEHDSDTEIKKTVANGGFGITPKSNNDSFPSDVIKYLYNADLSNGSYGTVPDMTGKHNVTSYFLVKGVTGFVNQANAYAAAGGTGAAMTIDDDPAALVAKLKNLFNEILSVSTTFVSASVPVNVYNRSEILDNIYLALFQPTNKTLWPGNVKKLKINSDMLLVDANNTAAIAADGRIKYDALTWWTNAATLNTIPDSNLADSQEAAYAVAGKDGRFVPRGGAGQKIPTPGLVNPSTAGDGTSRTLYVDNSSATTGLSNINSDAATVSLLKTKLTSTVTGTTSTNQDTRAACLIKYIRGYDISDIDSCGTIGATPSTVRPWLMGDVLHSRPIPINYGTQGGSSPQIGLVYGANDGFVRMLRNTTAAGAESGQEVWGFMPQEMLSKINTWRINAADQGYTAHAYGIDGAPTVYINDVNGNGTVETGDSVWMFIGTRRGGRAYYALDITTMNQPKLLWKITSDTAGFSDLGYTFSKPVTAKLNWGSGVKPVVIFAGGYDLRKDARTGSASQTYNDADSMGNTLYVVDAQTGALVWKAARTGSASNSLYVNANLMDSIPAEVNVYDSDGNGAVDRGYVGDTGGVLWRLDMPGTDRTLWTLKSVMSVGHRSGSEDRRFFHRADVSLTKDSSGPFDAVAIGSGDRENPLEDGVDNEVYLFKDRATTSGALPVDWTAKTRSDLANLTSNCLQDSSCSTTPDLSNGWYIELGTAGEKVLSSPVTVGGAIFFTTYVPPAGTVGHQVQCGPSEGSGYLYTLKLQDATAVNDYDVTNNTDTTTLATGDRSRALKSGGIPAEVVVLPVSGGSDGSSVNEVGILPPDLFVEPFTAKLFWRTFWYQDTQ